eukprot:364837-Chlamydomonas_euryale.AAC.2
MSSCWTVRRPAGLQVVLLHDDSLSNVERTTELKLAPNQKGSTLAGAHTSLRAFGVKRLGSFRARRVHTPIVGNEMSEQHTLSLVTCGHVSHMQSRVTHAVTRRTRCHASHALVHFPRVSQDHVCAQQAEKWPQTRNQIAVGKVPWPPCISDSDSDSTYL